MFASGFLIAILSYLVFSLGLLGLLDKSLLSSLLILFLLGIFFAFIIESKINLRKFYLFLLEDKLSLVFFGLLVFSVLVNLIGVFGPELSFDALWYHLTLPKMYLSFGRIRFIPGGLLYYSAAPQFTEMLYLAGLATNLAFLPKLMHFLFGTASVFLIYKLFRQFTDIRKSVAVSLLIYSTLLVGWLSISAYTDLALLFYVLLGFLALIYWKKGIKGNWLIEAALFFGVALAIKLTAGQIIVAVLITLLITRQRFKDFVIFGLFSLIPVLPWLSRSYLLTGNPVYPYATSWFFKSQSAGLSLSQWLHSRTPINFLKAVWGLVFTNSDILSPLLLITLPLLIIGIYKNKLQEKFSFFFGIILGLGFLFWFLTPLNYNRFFLPLLPIYFLEVFFVIKKLRLKKIYLTVCAFILITTSFVNLAFRSIANAKYLPYLLTKESERSFMKKNLNFNAGNFYDLDGQVNKLTEGKKVLVDGIHNQYYLNIDYFDINDHLKGQTFDYILASFEADEKYRFLPLVYRNRISKVSLYKAKIIF